MEIVRERTTLAAARRLVGDVALVPTMGNLHAGHLALVEAASRQSDTVWVSLFVNPLQFGPGEDFDSYPRTFDDDMAKLEAAGVALVFAPTVSEMYPGGVHSPTRISLPPLAGELCGRARPGHFEGACTAVLKLLNLTQATQACFGEKDFQQLTLIRRMVADLNVPVDIVPVPTVREADGLAMSSRNSYLDEDARARAPALHEHLQHIARELASGRRDFGTLERAALVALKSDGWAPDYIEIRGAQLQIPDEATREFRVLGAARLGGTRLIDNVTAQAPG